ncbi:class I lanthipeptide [uncultured Kordia sp.]|uniref:class I lanthipeptide n=1 Tax=uncultured Kordia sp. TaxID=507699 RepID=UPI0026150FCA|nr:class I lanthipeptide [uncultured Kordia sp.]
MKKKNFNKKLDLGKKQISKLDDVQGGAAITLGGGNCTSQLIKTCTWYSELYTACYCDPSWDGNCGPSIDRPCQYTEQPGCSPNTNFVCDA